MEFVKVEYKIAVLLNSQYEDVIVYHIKTGEATNFKNDWPTNEDPKYRKLILDEIGTINVDVEYSFVWVNNKQ